MLSERNHLKGITYCMILINSQENTTNLFMIKDRSVFAWVWVCGAFIVCKNIGTVNNAIYSEF